MAVVPSGPERIVNVIADGKQYRPFTTALSTGGYIVGWQDESGVAGPQTADDTRFALYDAFGTRLKADVLANTATASSQFQGAAAAFGDGKFVIAWTDYSAAPDSNGDIDSNNGGVKFQIFNADGSKSGGEIHANQTDAVSEQLRQDEPSVSVLSSGKFVVTWTNQDIDASSTKQIMARVFNADGSPVGNQFIINTNQDIGDQSGSTVIALKSGGFAVVWDDRDSTEETGGQTDTYLRIYNAAGSAQGAAKLANTNAGDPQDVHVSELADGRIAVVWSDYVTSNPPGDGSGGAIRARIFNPITETFGPRIIVNTTTSNDQTDPVIAGLPDGQFVVAWTDRSGTAGEDASFTAVRMQVFNALGTKVGKEILVNKETTFEQENPVIAVLADGRFAVSWQDNSQTGSDTEGFSIRSRTYDARLAAIDLDGTSQADAYQGTTFNDVLDGLAGNDVLKGGFGNDFIFGGAGIDLLFGDSNNDTLDGGANNDKLDGGAGSDKLNGGTGADKMTGGTGDDVYFVDNVGDKVIELPNGGSDTVRTTLLSYVLPANVEKLIYDGVIKIAAKGNGLDNVLKGGDNGDLFLVDSGGADSFIGGLGNDTMDFRLHATGATVNLATGTHAGAAAGDTYTSIETFFGSSTANDIFRGDTFAITFNGFGGNDKLTGSTKSDLLYGGDGTDMLSGREGADTLDGGRGSDTMTGGTGGDVFWFTNPTSAGGFGTDTITDYQDGTDKIRFAVQVAASTADFSISGNGTTMVTITMAEGTIIVKSAAAFTLSTADFLFG
ncbi:calcium-binding protein [Aestuariivirga sp.]|uniref:calcium-binding protein n=1 Tax=Aestuariivirga sp. TaxID=2650926 RepID=UPI0035944CC9